MKRIIANRDTSRGTIGINRNGETIFPESGHYPRDYVTGAFGFLKKKDNWILFLNLHFEHSLFGAIVVTSETPRLYLH